MAFTEEQKARINDWQYAQQKARQWRETEMSLRAEVMGFAWPAYQNAPTAGTVYADIAAGYKLKYEQSFSYNLKDTPTAFVEEILNKHFEPVAADLLVRWKPELSVSNYKKLTADEQRLFTPVLTIKPDAPKLELIAPK
jgi:hypothetical protein